MLCLAAALAGLVPALAAPPVYPDVVPGYALSFPRDHGAHPDFRTEWWYVTGWLDAGGGKTLGFQIAFFRSRPDLDQANSSRFAPRQLLFAHAAVSDPALGRLLHDQRSARAGFGLAEAAENDTAVRIDDWTFARAADGRYVAKIAAREFAFVLEFAPPTGAILLQGEAGLSRKGPRPEQASYYYSRPQLAVTGTLGRDGRAQAIKGVAWLDHEWSSAYLAPEASGWDWTGINFDDGSALMAFQIRDRNGGRFWAGGCLRSRDGTVRALGSDEVTFVARRHWRSPRTGAQYPIAMGVRADALRIDLAPLMDDQELDSRMSTGAVYWEGAVTAWRDGQAVGRGYLELTGYFRPLKLQ
jgi:predicted secreted hydrolase